MYNIESILIFYYLDMNMINDHERGRCVLNVKWSKYDISYTGWCNIIGPKKGQSTVEDTIRANL